MKEGNVNITWNNTSELYEISIIGDPDDNYLLIEPEELQDLKTCIERIEDEN